MLNELSKEIHKNAAEHGWWDKAGIDIDAIMREKCDYNRTRPYRHGGKKC